MGTGSERAVRAVRRLLAVVVALALALWAAPVAAQVPAVDDCPRPSPSTNYGRGCSRRAGR